MSRRNISPSYSPSLPAYEESFREESPVEESLSPRIWERPLSPSGWSDSTIPWSNIDSDEDDEEDINFSSPWPETPDPNQEIYFDEMPSDDDQWDYVWHTLRHEDEEDAVSVESSPSERSWLAWSDSTMDLEEREE